MSKKHRIEFHEQRPAVSGFITKFGGQPDWVSSPEWPLSRETGEPMRFICQIKLPNSLFGAVRAEMAYLFMTDEQDNFVDGTYDPNGGENAVILQPAGSTTIPTKSLAEGPTLYRMIKKSGQKLLVPEPCQFAVTFVEVEEVEPVQDEIKENKIGGRPVFLQGEELPFQSQSRLLLQLDSCSVPFYVNFGDAGVGYAFLNEAGDQAKFLWQCC